MTAPLTSPAPADNAEEAIALLRDREMDLVNVTNRELFYNIAEHTLIDLAEAASRVRPLNKVEFVDSGLLVTHDRNRVLLIQLRESDSVPDHCTVDVTVTDTDQVPFIPVHLLRSNHDPQSTCMLENISVAQTHALLRHFLIGDRFRYKINGKSTFFGWTGRSGSDPQLPYSLPAVAMEAGLLERFVLEDYDFSR